MELRRQKRALQESYARLQELEQLRDNLTHMIVHDLRSPLTTILLTLDVLKLELPDLTPEVEKTLEAALSNCALVSEMVTQLLDVSRLEAGQMPIQKTACDLAEVARNVLDSLAGLAEERSLILTAPEPVVAMVDADLMRRIISNLVGNAIKFPRDNGEIKISLTPQNGEVRVEVADNGPGIPPEYHQKIFEKFGQAKDGMRKIGTGLGLTFCKLAIEAHAGSIGVDSEIGQGSVFWFLVPHSSTPTKD